jgi:hypothetical protein
MLIRRSHSAASNLSQRLVPDSLDRDEICAKSAAIFPQCWKWTLSGSGDRTDQADVRFPSDHSVPRDKSWQFLCFTFRNNESGILSIHAETDLQCNESLLSIKNKGIENSEIHLSEVILWCLLDLEICALHQMEVRHCLIISELRRVMWTVRSLRRKPLLSGGKDIIFVITVWRLGTSASHHCELFRPPLSSTTRYIISERKSKGI